MGGPLRRKELFNVLSKFVAFKKLDIFLLKTTYANINISVFSINSFLEIFA